MVEKEPNRRKMVRIADYLTDAQIKLAVKFWVEDRRTFVDRVTKEIIEPNLPEINRKLGQENNARFLAYAVEYVLTQSQA